MSTVRRLAWRNIWRNKRRTILTLLAIIVSSGVLVFFMALQFSMYEASIRASVSAFQGHIQVQRRGYLDKPQMHLSFPSNPSTIEELRRIDGVAAVTERSLGFALVSSLDRTYGVQVVGVDPTEEPKVSSIPRNIRKGRFFQSRSANEVVIGEALSRNLKVKIDDEITLLGQGKDGSLAATVARVVGIYMSGVQELDRNLVEMPIEYFAETFSMDSQIHNYVITTNDLNLVPQLVNNIASRLGNDSTPSRELVVLPWDLLLPGIKQAIEFDLTFGWFFYSSLILIVAITILNTFLMSILERTREFGLMLSLGMKPYGISYLIFVESLFLTLVGLGGGVALGSGCIAYFNAYGFYLPGSEEIMKIWNIPVEAHPQFSVAALCVGPLIILGMTCLALAYPIWRVSRLEAVEALRG